MGGGGTDDGIPSSTETQGGITCGAIEDPRKSSKAIDERVIINFRDKNGVIARFRDKNVVIVRFCDKNVECLYIYIYIYDSFSDVGEIRVYFASKILTPCRMH